MSTEAPFCDGMTCQQILKGDKFEPEDDILYLDDEIEDGGNDAEEYAASSSTSQQKEQ